MVIISFIVPWIIIQIESKRQIIFKYYGVCLSQCEVRTVSTTNVQDRARRRLAFGAILWFGNQANWRFKHLRWPITCEINMIAVLRQIDVLKARGKQHRELSDLVCWISWMDETMTQNRYWKNFAKFLPHCAYVMMRHHQKILNATTYPILR